MDLNSKGSEPIQMAFIGVKDSCLEMKIRQFDPNLRLVINKITGKKAVFEFHPMGDEPKFLFYLENEKGEPKENENWVLNRLFVMMEKHEEKKSMGVDNWVDMIKDQSDDLTNIGRDKLNEETEYRVKTDHIQWRKAMRELNNEPVSDVTAGYQYQKGDL